MNRLVATIGLVVCVVVTVPLAIPGQPLRTPAVASTLAAVDRTVYRCESTAQATDCRRGADPAERLAGQRLTEIALLYRDGRLVRTTYVFNESGFDKIASELTAAFGTPMPGHELLRAGMAGVFENRYYIWEDGDQTWFAEQYFERVTTGALWHMDSAEFAALQAERDRSRVRGARDL